MAQRHTFISYFVKIRRYTTKGEEVFDLIEKLFPDPVSDAQALQMAKKMAERLPRRCWQKGPSELVTVFKEKTVVTTTSLKLRGLHREN